MSKLMEKGSMFFFYRNKVDVKKAKNLDDVLRAYLVLVPDKDAKARIILIGKKRMPEIHEGESKSTERAWMMVKSSGKPQEIAEELCPVEYETKTRGKRREEQAIPAAEGRYSIYERSNATRFTYKLSNPKKLGKAQKELGIQEEASYVITVKNPEMKVPGFPKERPDFSKKLIKKFGEKRWLDIEDTGFLDTENAQLALIGAHESLEEVDDYITGEADVFKSLALDKDEWPTDTLYNGDFCAPNTGTEAFKTASAAGIAKSLKGVDFPKKKEELADYAKDHGGGADVVNILSGLPKRKYNDMSDVQKGVSEARQ